MMTEIMKPETEILPCRNPYWTIKYIITQYKGAVANPGEYSLVIAVTSTCPKPFVTKTQAMLREG